MSIIKRLSVIFLLTGSAFVLSCNEDDPGPKEVLVTVNIEPGYFPDDHDIWIFLSNKFGKTIDVRQANDSTQIKFSGTPLSTMTLTIFRRVAFTNSGTGNVWNSFGFDSYQEIASGSIIDLKKGSGSNLQIPDVVGTVPFTLTDFDDSGKPEESLMITDGISTPYSVLDYTSDAYTGTNFSAQLYVRDNPSRILVTTYRDDVPVYRWLNDLQPGEAVEVSFDSFASCKTIPINKQVAHGETKTMSGSNFATSYIFSHLYTRQISNSSNLSQLPKLGYLDGFEKYFVSVVLNPLHWKTNLYYTKAGAVPESINLPDYNYSIHNDNLDGLSLAFSNDFTYKNAFFIQSDAETQVYWNLNASDGEEFKTPVIPSEIRKLYPMLSVNGLKLQFAAYTHCLDGYTYDEFVKDDLGSTRRNVYEELRYVVASE